MYEQLGNYRVFLCGSIDRRKKIVAYRDLCKLRANGCFLKIYSYLISESIGFDSCLQNQIWGGAWRV